MGKLAGPLAPLAIRSQPIDDVILVEEIPHSRIKKIFHNLNGLNVGFGLVFPAGRNIEQSKVLGSL